MTNTELIERLADDLKDAEESETSFTHFIEYHRQIAEHLIAKGWHDTPAAF